MKPVVVVLLVTAMLSGCARVATGDLPKIPPVPLDSVLPAVHEQLTRLRNAVERKPRSAAAAGRLGMAYLVYRQREAAAVAFERARLLRPAKWQ